jgi:signal transduction histidine kinase
MTLKEQSAPASLSGFQKLPVTAATLVRGLVIALGVTVLCLAILYSTGRAHISQAAYQLVIALTYSVFIALPSMLILNWVNFRYTDRFPRLVLVADVLVLLCTGTFGVLAGVLVGRILGIIAPGTYWRAFRGDIPFTIVITLAVGLSMVYFETMRFRLQAAKLELRTRQVEQERAYKLLAEAQLSSLESRIHPHFLFNTLNSIAALIPSDPTRAEATVGKLASLLRFSLNAHQSGLVPLSQELKIVRDYLEIEKTRFGTRLRYEIAVPDSLGPVKVPPLALQSLIENTVKHVVSKRTEGAHIQIRGSQNGGRVRLEVLDDGPGFSLDVITPEHGLGNLIARIELLFGAAGQLDVTREGEKTAVRLSFPA